MFKTLISILGAVILFVAGVIEVCADSAEWSVICAQNDENTLTVSWSEITKAGVYKVFRSEQPSGSFNSLGSTTKTEFTDETAKKNKIYYYIIQAYPVKDKKAGAAIKRSKAVKGAVVLLEKPILQTVLPSPAGNMLSWEKSSGAYGYAVYRSNARDAKFTLIGTTRGVTFTDNTIGGGSLVYYTVRARLSDPEFLGKNGNIEEVKSHIADNQWSYLLINKDKLLPKGYSISLEAVQGKFTMDKRCASYARKMLRDGKAAGLSLKVFSGYRSTETQEKNINRQIEFLMGKGYSRQAAEAKTYEEFQLPGASEHNAGIAVDILTENWYLTHDDLTVDFAYTKEFKWLSENAHKYGFILRYPADKQEITGISYEPWHYRFVGLYTAEKIYESGLSLEEYFEKADSTVEF